MIRPTRHTTSPITGTAHLEEELRRAASGPSLLPIAQSHNSHLGAGPTSFNNVRREIHIANEAVSIGDENGANVDEEMPVLSENQIRYEAATQLLRKKLAMIKYVVSSGQ